MKILQSDLTCWDITQCRRSDNCPARLQPDRPCWEIAKEMGDYRSNFKICHDCLVYLTKQANAILSSREIEQILEKKGVCVLASSCPQYLAK